MIEEEIINDVVYNLKRLTNLESISFKAVYRQQYDYDLTINGVTFACKVKTHLNKANCNLVVQRLRNLKELTDKPLIVAASYVSPEMFDSLPQEDISVVESSGNCKIVASPLFINISGQKVFRKKNPRARLSTKPG